MTIYQYTIMIIKSIPKEQTHTKKMRIAHTISLILIIISSLLLTNVFGQWLNLWNTNTILNTDINKAIDTNTSNGTIWDPIREWAYQIVNAGNSWQQIWWIISNDNEIATHEIALNKTLQIIKNIINYALGLVSLIALIYLLFHWFMIVTAAWDEARYKKWLAWIKYAAIALAWIWLSRFIISFIFWIIKETTT